MNTYPTMNVVFNLNYRVGILLTEKGWQHYYRSCTPTTEQPLAGWMQTMHRDAQGYHWLQAHEFLRVFGACFAGFDGPSYMSLNILINAYTLSDSTNN